MIKRLVAGTRHLVARVCPFQYPPVKGLSVPRIRKHHLVFGVLAGLTAMAASCSGGETPTAPSTTTNTMQFYRGTSDTDITRDGDVRRRIEYCKKLSPGHDRYDRCQQWLEKIARRGPGRGDTSKDRSRGDKKRRVEYCKSLEPEHRGYQRCQDWLHSKSNIPGKRLGSD